MAMGVSILPSSTSNAQGTWQGSISGDNLAHFFTEQHQTICKPSDFWNMKHRFVLVMHYFANHRGKRKEKSLGMLTIPLTFCERGHSWSELCSSISLEWKCRLVVLLHWCRCDVGLRGMSGWAFTTFILPKYICFCNSLHPRGLDLVGSFFKHINFLFMLFYYDRDFLTDYLSFYWKNVQAISDQSS